MPAIELWTDGSGTTGDKPGGWAWVLVARKNGEVLKRTTGFGGVSVGGTNNRMEISAVLYGLRALRLPTEVTVFTDSEYVARAFPEGWIDRWRRDSKAAKNMDLWIALEWEVKRHRRVAWKHVDGHSGLELNELADRLAGDARLAMVSLVSEPQEVQERHETAGPSMTSLFG